MKYLSILFITSTLEYNLKTLGHDLRLYSIVSYAGTFQSIPLLFHGKTVQPVTISSVERNMIVRKAL